MKTLEKALWDLGYCRGNDDTRWYPRGPGIMQIPNADVHLVYRPEHAPEGRIVIMPKSWLLPIGYGFHSHAIASFSGWLEFLDYLNTSGQLS